MPPSLPAHTRGRRPRQLCWESNSDKATEGVRSAEQERLLKESKVVAIGYCSRCHAAVQLNEKMHCLVHKRSHGKDVRFAMPQDVASISAAIQQQQQDLIRKTRVRRGAGCAVILVTRWIVPGMGEVGGSDRPRDAPVSCFTGIARPNGDGCVYRGR